MANYLSMTRAEQEAMLAAVGAKNVTELYRDVPSALLAKPLNIPSGVSQQETAERMEAMAKRNTVFDVVLRGAGSYRRYIPSVVGALSKRSEFLTAYTPYQAEMSQGILQSIFEYQTMIARLTGTDVANASVYSGASAAAEGVLMTADRNRNVVIVATAIRPDVKEVLRTYTEGRGVTLKFLPLKDGRCDSDALREAADKTTAAIYAEQPDFYGMIEDLAAIGAIAKEVGAKFVVGLDPAMGAILKAPGACGADIVVGEAQTLGLPTAFGGLQLGFMACKQKEMRKLPGRIVGETVDAEGNRAYVLTLQAREQHIRRDKASSNICSNQAHCALTAAIYMAAMGPQGMREVATASASLAHYFARLLTEIPGVSMAYGGEFLQEFVTVANGKSEAVLGALAKEGVLGGLPLDGDRILWCCTETVRKEDLDRAAAIIRRAVCD